MNYNSGYVSGMGGPLSAMPITKRQADGLVEYSPALAATVTSVQIVAIVGVAWVLYKMFKKRD